VNDRDFRFLGDTVWKFRQTRKLLNILTFSMHNMMLVSYGMRLRLDPSSMTADMEEQYIRLYHIAERIGGTGVSVKITQDGKVISS
jgi:hypothetical protein